MFPTEPSDSSDKRATYALVLQHVERLALALDTTRDVTLARQVVQVELQQRVVDKCRAGRLHLHEQAVLAII